MGIYKVKNLYVSFIKDYTLIYVSFSSLPLTLI